ncbi:TrmH family RNA methyltransferase [bacterium]|nr:TrmH family RNA methyltransferase [bacterium]
MHKLKLEQLGRPSVEEFSRAAKLPLVIVMDNIRSMQNVGSVFRTCDAFAVEKIVLCGITAQPPHRDIHRAALGATETVAWQYEKDSSEALKMLRSEGYTVVGLEQTDESKLLHSDYYQPKKGQKYALVLGNEVEGISDNCLPLLDFALEIPQMGTKHSLNVSVAAGVAIWAFFEKLMPLH